MRVNYIVRRFCSHCNHDSVQTYLAHHPYDSKKRDLWDGDPQTAEGPAAHFVFSCRNCGEVLVYHYEAMDEFEFESLFPIKQNGIQKMDWDEDEISSNLKLVWPPTVVAQPQKTQVEVKFRIGICPNCPIDTQQRFLFSTDEFLGPILEDGLVTGYSRARTLSLFRCQGCNATLFYETMFEDEDCGYSLEALEDPDPQWIINDPYFLELSNLVYASPITSDKPAKTEKSILDPSTPLVVRRCYDIGTAVRSISKELYVVQLRKSLEAVCHNLGAPEFLGNGKRAMLWQRIDELGSRNIVGEFICNVAHELKDISNTGAHYSEREVTDSDIRKLEHLLALITTYVYGSR